MQNFYYVYVIECADKEWYVGYTSNLKERIQQHQNGEVQPTAYRLPIRLIYYEASLSEKSAQKREKQLKTGFGRAYLNRRLTR